MEPMNFSQILGLCVYVGVGGWGKGIGVMSSSIKEAKFCGSYSLRSLVRMIKYFKIRGKSWPEVVKLIEVRVGTWALQKKEFQNISNSDLMRNWTACMFGPDMKERKSV